MTLFGRFLYALVCVILFPIFRMIFRTRVIGRERLPRTGGLLVAANHISWADPPFLGSVLGRPVQFMAMVELFRKPALGWIGRQVGAFPVDRARADAGAVREAVRRVRAGGCVAIFPEGGIRLTQQSVLGGDPEFKPGAGMIALLGGAPILPVIIRDTRKPYERRHWFRGETMSLTIGQPFCLWLPDTLPAGERRRLSGEILRQQLLKTVQLDC